MPFLKRTRQNGAQNKQGNVLLTTTVRDFDGGLNIVDADLNMKPKFAKVLDNMERGIDGSLSVRPGTKLFAVLNAGGDTSPAVNIHYFNNVIIAVQTSGRVSKIDASGVVTSINTSWGATTSVSFTVFNSQLVICNGVNKPLVIEGNINKPNYMVCIYLVDAGSGSNVNTPIGSLVISHAQYTIISGITTAPSTIYISARGTSGTYLGDPLPNDAVALDLGPRVSLGSATITGMVSYRDKLLVCFERGVLPLNLGVYSGTPSVHTPSDDGFIEEYGCLAHRSLISVGDDTFFCDNIGVNSIERVVLYNTLRPQRASELIDPAITALIQPLSPAQIAKYVFAVYDMRHRRYMLFVPVFAQDGVTVVETIGFSYTNIPTLKISAWAKLRGWNWVCGCRTALQNVLFASSNYVYLYDFDNVTQNADYVGDTRYNAGLGVAISFMWELPWADFNKRMNTKHTMHLAMDTTGTATFQVAMYVDNIRTDDKGVDAPALMQTFAAGSSVGYGIQSFGTSPYGADYTPTVDERLVAWPAKFKINKLVVSGTTMMPLKVVSISLSYQRGSVRR